MINSILVVSTILTVTLLLGLPALILVWFFPQVIFLFSRIWSRAVLLSARGLKVEISGLENLDRSQSYIFLSNHQSAFDIPVLITAIPFNTRFIAKKELSKVPVWGWVVSNMGHVMIDRRNITKAKESIREATDIIKRRKLSIIAFPEGTRTRDGLVRPFKKGVFFIALHTGLPIVPVSIRGAYEIYPHHTRWSYQPGTIRVKFHPPVDPEPYSADSKDELISKVRDIIRKEVEGAADENQAS